MVLKNRKRAIVNSVSYKKNEQVILAIPQDNLLRRISLHCKFIFDTAATAGTGIKNDSILNLIKRIQVRLNGSDSIFDVDLRSYFHALTFEYGAKPYMDTFAIPSASSSGTFEVEIPIDFALIRNQISDYSALVPAHLLDSLDLIIDWGSETDVITTVNNTTVSSSTKIGISIIEVYSNTGDSKEIDDVLQNLTKVYEGVEQTPITRAYTSYPADELPVQVRPVPARHLTSVIFGINNITDGNPSYSNAVISDVKLENVKGGGEAIFYDIFSDLNHEQKSDFRLESDNVTGIIILDWTDLRNGSLDNMDVDALKYKILTAAPTASKENAIRIYKKYIPQ